MTISIYNNSKHSLELRENNFISKSGDIHNYSYDYSSVKYKNNSTKVKIICKVHGIFKQNPKDHLNGQGCSLCSNNRKSNTKCFIDKSKNIHGGKYNYSKVNYINAHKKVDIVCDYHGSFFQKPNDHLTGKGCSKCAFERKGGIIVKRDDLDANNICYMYTIKLSTENEVFYKTGITDNLERRHNKITYQSNYKIEVIDIIIDTRYNCNKLETKILNKRQRLGKYYPNNLFDGYTECYKILKQI